MERGQLHVERSTASLNESEAEPTGIILLDQFDPVEDQMGQRIIIIAGCKLPRGELPRKQNDFLLVKRVLLNMAQSGEPFCLGDAMGLTLLVEPGVPPLQRVCSLLDCGLSVFCTGRVACMIDRMSAQHTQRRLKAV
jgi:hypothetical protein